jgi:two-component system phosphate regulon sensor histidine kinase PhoR
MESGELHLEMISFDIKDLAVEVLADLEIQASIKNIELGFKEGSMSNCLVYCDQESIRQVLLNLVTNAIKYGKEEGYVQLGFYDMDKDLVLIEVSDNGIGIEEEHHKHLFDRFYRVDKSRSRQIGGSGLGLSIVKHILERHNQSIHVRSSIGIGTTMGFTLEKAAKI